ncbi:DUF4124 domain-containing protein [Vibrio cholerae]|uniref:DUF4124 domain-containing protein n=1 Tax=Vibrio cholerae TaxID=666 RepID=UPI001DF75E01|nr:DUF4124 domain-containing protein [Vibrio cholerae]EGQ9186919.1 DUF4124 domain-containing protein [Vibrio cholerae]EKF9602153.1 DUF4124 domain-containing protein [Vibrio cholerae]MDY7586551.1 DUF4124 domain-containing protein [Vibrio cholerae]
MSSSRLLWLLISVLWVPQLAAQNVYTWVDEKGVLHFSDTPQSDKAKSIHLPDYQAQAPAPSFDSTELTDSTVSPAPQTLEPLKISLISPKHDDTVRNNSGNLFIRSELNRKLSIGEQLQLMMDGRPYGAPTTQSIWELKNVDRGTHTFSIQAIESGKIIASSSIITVHLHRATVK